MDGSAGSDGPKGPRPQKNSSFHKLHAHNKNTSDENGTRGTRAPGKRRTRKRRLSWPPTSKNFQHGQTACKASLASVNPTSPGSDDTRKTYDLSLAGRNSSRSASFKRRRRRLRRVASRATFLGMMIFTEPASESSGAETLSESHAKLRRSGVFCLFDGGA